MHGTSHLLDEIKSLEDYFHLPCYTEPLANVVATKPLKGASEVKSKFKRVGFRVHRFLDWDAIRGISSNNSASPSESSDLSWLLRHRHIFTCVARLKGSVPILFLFPFLFLFTLPCQHSIVQTSKSKFLALWLQVCLFESTNMPCHYDVSIWKWECCG